MQHLPIGTDLQHGKYRIEYILGQGGFGITYLACNTMLEGWVAIKEFFIKDLCSRDEENGHLTIPSSVNQQTISRFKKKFLKEARTIFHLSHPNIVRILDVFEENNTAYYVMDYIEGETLRALVQRNGALPENEALDYIYEAGNALSYIHSENINHLDVKPGNLMRRTKDGRIFLIDFGVAKQYDSSTSEVTTTPIGITPAYSPPEQYSTKGLTEFSPQSDVYSLAATLYYLLTGQAPPESLEMIIDGLPVSALQQRGISPAIISALSKAMKARCERTQTIAEFLTNLSLRPPGVPLPLQSVPTELPPRGRQRIVSGPQRIPAAPKKKNGKSWLIASFAVAIFTTVLACIALPFLFNRTKTIHPGQISSQSSASPSSTPLSQTFQANGVTFEMIKVEGGTFTMGATSREGVKTHLDELPAHEVTLSSYYIGKTEVTQALWNAVVGYNPSYSRGNNKPVEMVSWEDCQVFITTLNSITGRHFRLPTEAEWEYAARGGKKSQGYIYSGSNNLDDVAWYHSHSGSTTHDVATKRPNELGIYDMSGNVWEWCADWYAPYSSSPQSNPAGPNEGTCRVGRGGSWINNADNCRIANRGDEDLGLNGKYLGLRLALSE